MKILVVQDYLRSGGTERQSILLANAFAAAGHATTLLTFRPGGALAGTVSAAVERRSLQPFDLGLDWFAPGLTRAARRLAPEIVLCMGRMANCYAAPLSAGVRAAVVSTMRTGKPLPGRFRRGLRASRHVIANSDEARATLMREHAIAADKISVIHNSLVFPASAGQPAAASARAAWRAKHGAGPNTLVLVCVAMFRPEKNQRELIEVVAGLPASANWQLWLAGDGPARGSCEQLAAAKPPHEKIKFLGFERDPSPLYAAADVAVHASWSEALSNFLIEAQAHGVPFVAYDAQGIRECGVPNQTGWVIRRDDREAFRNALLRRIAASPFEREKISRQAREFARRAFDPARQVEAYLEVFERLRRISAR